MRRPVDSYTKISSTHGQKTNRGTFGRHLGVDYARPEGGIVRSPVNGRITFSGHSTSLGNYYEIIEDGNGRIHRLAHLKSLSIGRGAIVKEGQDIGRSGNTGVTTGPHLHWDVRRANTAWNDSFNNYYDPELLLKPAFNMPPIGSLIQLLPTDKRTTFRAGTTTQVGTINVNANDFIYIVRGYDPKYPNRIIINSASAGGNGVALALYYTNGQRIPGWKQL